jgi:hypothetical protein
MKLLLRLAATACLLVGWWWFYKRFGYWWLLVLNLPGTFVIFAIWFDWSASDRKPAEKEPPGR